MTQTQTVDVADEFAALNRLYSSGDPVEIDPYPLYRELRDTMPVMEGDILAKYKVPSQADFLLTGRRIVTLFRYEDVARAMQDDASFSARLASEGLGPFLGEGILTAYDGAAHRRLRGPMQRSLTPAILAGWKQRLVEPQIRAKLEELKPLGAADLVRAFSLRFPIDVIYRVLGYPDDRAFAERFAGLALRILSGTPTDPQAVQAAHAAAVAAGDELNEMTLEVVRKRRADGAEGDDMMARMLRAADGKEPLDNRTIADLIRATLPAAAETTTRTFGVMLLLLIDHPELLERLRADRSLMSRAINETMRFEPTASYVAREARIDMEFHGVKIPAGTALSLCIGSAQRDERVFENPDRLDFDRTMRRPILGFGSGAHICLGMPIARLEVEVAMNAVLDILPNIRRDPDKPASLIRGLNLRGPDDLHVRWD
jgi:cytochrome P450